MPNLVNRMVVREMTEDLGQAEGMVVVSFGGLTVKETEGLRGNLADKGVRLRMVRNKLARLALKERGLEFSSGALEGNTAIAFGDTEGAVHAAKVFSEKDLRKSGKVKFQAGLLEGVTLDGPAAASLADIPDRDTLNAQILGVISGPARSLVGTLAALPGAVARVLNARTEQLPGDES